MKPITEFQYLCTPLFREKTLIQSMIVYIRAETREVADQLFADWAHKFFDLDLRQVVNAIHGYRQD